MTDVLCAKCKVAIQGPNSPKPDSVYRCPSCGIEERYDVIKKEAQAYLEWRTKQDLNKKMAEIARKSKFVTVTPFDTSTKKFRFILDF